MAENKTDKSGAAVRIPPPFAGVLTILIGYAIGKFMPILTAYELVATELYWIGGAIIVFAGIVLGVWPAILIKDTGQKVTPWSET